MWKIIRQRRAVPDWNVGWVLQNCNTSLAMQNIMIFVQNGLCKIATQNGLRQKLCKYGGPCKIEMQDGLCNIAIYNGLCKTFVSCIGANVDCADMQKQAVQPCKIMRVGLQCQIDCKNSCASMGCARSKMVCAKNVCKNGPCKLSLQFGVQHVSSRTFGMFFRMRYALVSQFYCNFVARWCDTWDARRLVQRDNTLVQYFWHHDFNCNTILVWYFNTC